MATARSVLIDVLGYTSSDYLDAHWPDQDLTQIADHILTSRDEETLHRAADEYERDQAAQYPGAIYGALRRIRAYKVGAYLRAKADDAIDALHDRLEHADLDAEQQARHFQTICGERESYRQAWKHEQKHRAAAEARVRELEAEVVRLTAGQCTDSRAMCEQHHLPPVAGCPYPRCQAAHDRRAPVALTPPADLCGCGRPDPGPCQPCPNSSPSLHCACVCAPAAGAA